MKPVKRIEIVTLTLEIHRLLRAVENAGARGYTVINDARGKGDRGERGADELSDVFKNSLVLLACEPEIANRVLEAVRPILARFGGVCIVSDAEYLIHETR